MPAGPEIYNRPDSTTPLPQALHLDGDPAEATLTIAADWAQGRTAFGGLPAAASARAMQQLVHAGTPDETRLLRSITVHFIAPIPVGTASVRARLLREGRHMTQAAAEVWVGDRLALMANAAFGASRDSALEVCGPSPTQVGRPDDLLAMPYIPGAMPAFTQHIDYRWAQPHFPFTGGDTHWVDGWCRPKAQLPIDAALVLMLIDAWPAPVLTMAHKPTSASSVTWSVNFIDDHLQTPLPTGSWVQVAHRSPASKGGYADGTADVWAADGRLLARSRQLVTLFG